MHDLHNIGNHRSNSELWSCVFSLAAALWVTEMHFRTWCVIACLTIKLSVTMPAHSWFYREIQKRPAHAHERWNQKWLPRLKRPDLVYIKDFWEFWKSRGLFKSVTIWKQNFIGFYYHSLKLLEKFISFEVKISSWTFGRFMYD